MTLAVPKGPCSCGGEDFTLATKAQGGSGDLHYNVSTLSFTNAYWRCTNCERLRAGTNDPASPDPGRAQSETVDQTLERLREPARKDFNLLSNSILAVGGPPPNWESFLSGFQAGYMPLDTALHVMEEVAEICEKWAYESRNGGWSTHQVDANRKTAAYLRKFVGQRRPGGAT